MTSAAPSLQRINEIWYTRCPVPTASGLALNQGWLAEEFAPDGISVSVLQDAPATLRRHHFDHQLESLFREGGNIPALATRSEGARTRLIGLPGSTNGSRSLCRKDSGIDSPDRLRGVRIAIPGWEHARGLSIWRGWLSPDSPGHSG